MREQLNEHILGQVSYSNNGQPVQSLEYKPSGVILDLMLIFNEDNINNQHSSKFFLISVSPHLMHFQYQRFSL